MRETAVYQVIEFMRAKAPVIRLKPNEQRIRESVLFLVWEAQRTGKHATKYDLVKSVFLADRRHLNVYGRPITFDRYFAMEHGPVPSRVYELLNADPAKAGLPWQKDPAGPTVFCYSNPSREVDLDVLSESDMEALAESFITVKSLGFAQIRKLTHEDAAYVDAWEDGGDCRSFEMSYVMLFDVPDFDKAEDLAFASEHL